MSCETMVKKNKHACRVVRCKKKALPVSRVFSVYYDTHDEPGVAPPCLLWLQEQAAVLLWNMDGYQTEIVSTFFLLAHRCHAAMDARRKCQRRRPELGHDFLVEK